MKEIVIRSQVNRKATREVVEIRLTAIDHIFDQIKPRADARLAHKTEQKPAENSQWQRDHGRCRQHQAISQGRQAYDQVFTHTIEGAHERRGIDPERHLEYLHRILIADACRRCSAQTAKIGGHFIDK
jgi:hypothetical protein